MQEICKTPIWSNAGCRNLVGWYNAAGTQRRPMGERMPDDNQRFRAEAIGVEAEALINRLRDCIVETFPEPAGDTHYVVLASLSAVMAMVLDNVHPEAKARVLAWLCAQIGKDLYEAVTGVSIQGR